MCYSVSLAKNHILCLGLPGLEYFSSTLFAYGVCYPLEMTEGSRRTFLRSSVQVALIVSICVFASIGLFTVFLVKGKVSTRSGSYRNLCDLRFLVVEDVRLSPWSSGGTFSGGASYIFGAR